MVEFTVELRGVRMYLRVSMYICMHRTSRMGLAITSPEN